MRLTLRNLRFESASAVDLDDERSFAGIFG